MTDKPATPSPADALVAKDLAALLNGREYRKEMTREEEAAAKAAGLVVVFGASDDLMEFRGAVHDELDAYEGTTAYVTPEGLLQNDCVNDRCPYHNNAKAAATAIVAEWDTRGYSWVYTTSIPHHTFDVMEDGETYCSGIVFSLADVPESST